MKRFKFALEPLLKKQSWELDTLRTEKAAATQAVNQVGQAVAAMENKIAAACEESRQLTSEPSNMGLARRDLLAVYIKHQSALAQAKRKELEQARNVEAQVAEQLMKALQQLKTLEKLRDQARRTHEYQGHQAQMNEADENWLTRRKHA
jgi:hypothetical protein